MAQQAAEEPFGLAEAVDVGGVVQGDAEVVGTQQTLVGVLGLTLSQPIGTPRLMAGPPMVQQPAPIADTSAFRPGTTRRGSGSTMLSFLVMCRTGRRR